MIRCARRLAERLHGGGESPLPGRRRHPAPGTGEEFRQVHLRKEDQIRAVSGGCLNGPEAFSRLAAMLPALAIWQRAIFMVSAPFFCGIDFARACLLRRRRKSGEHFPGGKGQMPPAAGHGILRATGAINGGKCR